MKSNYLVSLGIGIGIGSIIVQSMPAAVVATGFLIASGLYRIAEK